MHYDGSSNLIQNSCCFEISPSVSKLILKNPSCQDQTSNIHVEGDIMIEMLSVKTGISRKLRSEFRIIEKLTQLRTRDIIK